MSRSRSEYDSQGTLLSDTNAARKWAQLLAITLRVPNERQEFVDGRVDVHGSDGSEPFSIPIHDLETGLERGAGGANSRMGVMKSLGVERLILIVGQWFSVSLEEAFWKGLNGIATESGLTLSELVANINSGRHHTNLSSAIRLFVLGYYRTKIGAVSGARGSHVDTTQRHKQALAADVVGDTPLDRVGRVDFEHRVHLAEITNVRIGEVCDRIDERVAGDALVDGAATGQA